ncbi:MAG: ATP-binding protein [Bryobacterales bacterium]|nr:ATP-binding protein [Bryobacterales bacterium]
MAAKKAAKKRQAAGRLTKASAVLARHFGRIPLATIMSSSREYPTPARVDLDRALNELLPQYRNARHLSLHVEHLWEALTLSHMLGNRNAEVYIGPLQSEQVDLGEDEPVNCTKRALWVAQHRRLPFAVIAGQAKHHGRESGLLIEVAVPPGEAGAELARRLLLQLDERVRRAPAYRGRVISLEQTDRYDGGAGAIRVHKLRRVEQNHVILPQRTLALLDRNVIGFVAQREKLRALGLPARKGLLFYGPPGTGKTHTLHYLASRLEGHTMLLITSEQVGLLDQYFQLARFLQPAILVIEDADLIARSRESMGSACEEVLLNKLLNEMDGLREDAEILFVLTTNRPEHLEAALASRLGRIDQAIEFPLPDDEGRRRLARLYSADVAIDPNLLDFIVRRTQGVSGAFLKELMRRAAQFLLEIGDTALHTMHLESALGEMLFDGGSLNRKLLGGDGIATGQGA